MKTAMVDMWHTKVPVMCNIALCTRFDINMATILIHVQSDLALVLV